MAKETEPLSADELALIAAFRGLPRGQVRRTRAPRTMDSAIRQFFAIHRLDSQSPEAVIVDNWSTLVGEAFAARCQPVRLRGGRILVLAVENPTLRQEIAFQKRHILQKVRSLPGCENVSDLSVRG